LHQARPSRKNIQTGGKKKKSVLSTQMQQISENTVARAHQKPIIIKNQCVPISLMVSGFQQPQQQCSTLLCVIRIKD
jgi:hypothetical protein